MTKDELINKQYYDKEQDLWVISVNAVEQYICVLEEHIVLNAKPFILIPQKIKIDQVKINKYDRIVKVMKPTMSNQNIYVDVINSIIKE